jgi:hypothetical protein
MHSDRFRQLSRQSFASLVLWVAYGLVRLAGFRLLEEAEDRGN